MGIGNIGWTEFIVILAIALIFFGPRRLPGIAQTLGKSLREFQKALNEVKVEMTKAAQEADARKDVGRILPRPAELMSVEESAPPEPASAAPASPAEAAPETATPAATTPVTPAAKSAEPETTREAEVTVTPAAPAPTKVAEDDAAGKENVDGDPPGKNVS
jgi:Tat protein translocase TatB subunit